MSVDGHQVRSNQFLFKALLVNVMLLLRQGPISEEVAMMTYDQLTNIRESIIAYVEGDRCHPFLEEVIAHFRIFYEASSDTESAILMQHRVIGIEERLYGEETKEMWLSFGKLAVLYEQMGDTATAMSYYDKSVELKEKWLVDGKLADASEDQTRDFKMELSAHF